jgi:hypothetical protein
LAGIKSGDYRRLVDVSALVGETVWRIKVSPRSARIIVVDIGERKGLVVEVDKRKNAYNSTFVREMKQKVSNELEKYWKSRK